MLVRRSSPLAHRLDRPSRLGTAAIGLIAISVVAAGCGGSDDSADPLSPVQVSGDINSEPTVTLEDTPFELGTSTVSVLTAGDGDTVGDTDTVAVQFALVNGADGETIQSSYAEGPVNVTLDDPQGLTFLLDSIKGRAIGDRLLVGIAPEDGFGDDLAEDAPFSAEDTLLYIVDILGVVADRAIGEPVTDIPAGLPEVQTDDEDAVTGITVPAGDAPAELVIQPLIIGSGRAVTAEDTLTVQYWGVLYSDGSTFDSSWERGEPAEFALTGVIPGWTQGLDGQTVGSRVLLIVPPDLGYGDQEQQGIPASSTLVFAVDILAAG